MIKNGIVVSFAYVLTNPEGEEIDRGSKEEPFTYMHGASQIVPGLENKLLGLKIGDKKKVVVSPEEGYGIKNPKLKMKLKRDLFPKDFPLQEGIQFNADMGNDSSGTFTVLSFTDKEVEVDGNHPLAGVTLHFDVEILNVREATKEEIEHGHAHDGDGHHHH